MKKMNCIRPRPAAQKARIASAPGALICPENKREKDPWSFSPLESPFSLTHPRPKRLNGLFYLPGFILGRSMGQIRRMGGRKARQKRIFHQTRGFNLLSFRRPCTEFDLT